MTSRRTLWLFVFFQALYALTSSGNAFRGIPDEFEVYFQTERLVDARDLSIPQTLTIRQPVIVNGQVTGSQPIFFGKIGRDGKPYAPYGPLAAALAVPHHLVARAVAKIAGVPRSSGAVWTLLVGGLTTLSSATAAALAVIGFHRAALALGATSTSALMWSLLLGGTTVLWPYATTLYTEAWLAAALVWAAALLLDRRVALAASLLAVTVLIKPTSLIFTPGVLVAAAWHERPRCRATTVLLGGVGFAAMIHVAWNLYRFNSAFDFGYDWAEIVPLLPARPFALIDVPRGLLVLLLSPGKSIFMWAPVLLFSVFAARHFWVRHRAAALGLATTAGLGLLMFAAYQFPEGGYSHGPRHLVPIIPLLLLPAAASPRTGSRASLGLCAAVGFTMAALATSVSFLEDQGIGRDLGGAARLGYYERINPAPGRPWNRYRLDYLPFVRTLASPEWRPDYFSVHLAQVRQEMAGGQVISSGLVYGLPTISLLLLFLALVKLLQGFASSHRAERRVMLEQPRDG